MKKILLSALCAAALVSCASKGAVLADPLIAEAKTLQTLAKDKGVQVPASAINLIADAEKQNADKQVTTAAALADEATLQLQIALLKQENKDLADSLGRVTESLNAYRKTLEERKNSGKK